MSDFISCKHSFNAGDLIIILPGLRQLCRETGKKVRIYQRLGLQAFYYEGEIISTKNEEGKSVCMNRELFDRLKPLLESQDYVESFVEWKGEPVDLDFDLTRDSKAIPMPSGMLHSYAEAIFPQMSTDLSESWLSVPVISGVEDKVIINRTKRYNNPYVTYYFLKQHTNRIIFSGTYEEYSDFCTTWELDIPHLNSADFLYTASVIKSCKFGIFNQSVHFHLADALKSKRVLELCPSFPNTFITGANGYQFYKQAALEYYFQKLIST